jgi:hypothetical protein
MKCVGRYKFVVAGAGVERTRNEKDVVKLDLTLTSEFVNNEWHDIPTPVPARYYQSLSLTKGKGGKCPAQITAEKFRNVFGFKKSLKDVADLQFSRGECVCVDNDSNYTRVDDIYPENAQPQAPRFSEIPSDIFVEIDKLFAE